MGVLILAGPPAVGHNAIGDLVCARRVRAALIDVDEVRYMQRVPYASPWEGAEGERQYKLGIRNACALARRFDADGSDVVLLDLTPPETLALYRAELASVRRLVVALLHAEGDDLVARDVARARATGFEPSFGTVAFGRCAISCCRTPSATTAFTTPAMSAGESADSLAPLLDRCP